VQVWGLGDVTQGQGKNFQKCGGSQIWQVRSGAETTAMKWIGNKNGGGQLLKEAVALLLAFSTLIWSTPLRSKVKGN